MAKFDIQKCFPTYAGGSLHCYAVINRETTLVALAPSAYLLYLAIKGTRPTTLKTYSQTLAAFFTTLANDPEQIDWRSITDQQMRIYFEKVLFESEGNGARSIDQKITRLKGFYEWAYNSGWIAEKKVFSWTLSDDLMQAIKLVEGQANSNDPFDLFSQYIPEEQFTKLTAYPVSKGVFERSRDTIILMLGYYSGLRASEVVYPQNFSVRKIKAAIEEADRTGANGFLWRVIGKGRSGGKVREVHIPRNVSDKIRRFINVVRTHAKVPGDLLISSKSGKGLGTQFPSSLFTKSKNNLIRHCKSDDLQDWSDTDRHYHSLRHSYATNLSRQCHDNGDDPFQLVAERLGHENPQTTKIYIAFDAALRGDVAMQSVLAGESKRYGKFNEGYQDDE